MKKHTLKIQIQAPSFSNITRLECLIFEAVSDILELEALRNGLDRDALKGDTGTESAWR